MGRILATKQEIICYTGVVTFGTGISLRQFSKKLRNSDTRQRIILDRAERNSIIEGLPRFTKQTKQECLRELHDLAGKQ